MIVLVNAGAGGGKAEAAWRRLAPHVGEHHAVLTRSAEEAESAIAQAIADGETTLVAAGGDGAVNLALNAVMDPATDAPRAEVAIGAIGLGSSNDFHKPFSPHARLAGVPVALADPVRVDVGRADWLDPAGARHSRYFLLNASLGATAKGNYRYNHPDGLLAVLKGISPALAIQWGTLEAIARFENVPGRLWVDSEAQGPFAISNLGVIKRQYFCGGMRYDTPVTPDDGHFDVNLCAGMTTIEFVRAVAAISGGRFVGLPKTHHWRARHVRVVPDAPTALELDGEVFAACEAELRVIPRAIAICRPRRAP